MKLPLILPVPLLAPAFVSIFAPKIAPKAQPADLDRIGYDTIKNAPPEAGKEARREFGRALRRRLLAAQRRLLSRRRCTTSDEDLTDDEIKRYSRHLILEDVGRGPEAIESTKWPSSARRSGSPALLYLAAAGVSTLTIVERHGGDANLQRQIVTTPRKLGFKAARQLIGRRQPLVGSFVEGTQTQTTPRLLKGHDVILDGCDNFDKIRGRRRVSSPGHPLRVCCHTRFEGQASTFNYPPGVGPSYRDLMPEGPAPGTVPSCAEGGVLGVLPGVLGCIQATEVLKVLLGRPSSDCLAGRVLVYDALRMTFREIPLVKGAAECAAAEKSLEEEPLPPDAHTSLTATECADKLRAGWAPYVLDVRLPQEAEICQLPFADALCPHRNIKAAADGLPRDVDLLVHCKSGFRSRAACRDLASLGFDRLYNMEGGILAWARDVDPRLPTY